MSVPNTTPFVLATPDSTNLPGSRTLAASGGLDVPDTGTGGTITVTTVGNLKDLNDFGTNGFVNYNSSSSPKFVPLTFQAGSGIAITNPNGQGGNPSFSVIPNTSLQRIQVQNASVVAGTRAAINFIAGTNTSITAGDNPLNGTVDINISASTSSAPEAAKYIVQTPDIGLPAAQALNSLDEGILKVGAGTGVISTAIPDTDYQRASPKLTAISGMDATNGSLIVGNGGSYSELSIAPTGYILTSSGSSASWQPNNSGQPFPVVYVLNDPLTIMEPNTFYSARASTDNTIFVLPDGVLVPPSPTPLPNYGDQFLFAASSGSPTFMPGVSCSDVLTILDGAATYTNTHVGMTVPVAQSGFIWFMYIGIIDGRPSYQVLSKSSNIIVTT